MARLNDGYDTDSGLVDECTGVITDSVWEYDAEYRDGDIPRLVLQIQTETDGEQVFKYGTGPGWEANKDGSSVSHPSKDNFNKNSDMGKLVTSAVNCGARELLASRGRPQSAATWKGLQVEMERVNYSTTIDGESVEWDRMMFTRISGDKGKGTPTEASNEDVTAEIKAKVATIWEECKPDHGKFMETVFVQAPGVLLDPELENWVSTAGNWS